MYLFAQNYKTLMKEIKEELNKWEDIMHLWVEIFNIINLFIFPKLIYRFIAKFEKDSVDIVKLILKLMWIEASPRIANPTLRPEI